jgi:hypothetical protein
METVIPGMETVIPGMEIPGMEIPGMEMEMETAIPGMATEMETEMRRAMASVVPKSVGSVPASAPEAYAAGWSRPRPFRPASSSADPQRA